MKLSEIATVTSGPLLSRYSKEKNQAKATVGKIDVITPRCIGNGYINLSEAAHDETVREIPEEFLTRKGDLILQLSRPYSSALIEDEEGLLYPSYLVSIRCKDEDDRFYLLSYFHTRHFQENLDRNTSSSLRSLLSINAIKNLEIPYPEKEVRNRLGNRFYKAVKTNKLSDEIFSLETVLIDRNIRNMSIEKEVEDAE